MSKHINHYFDVQIAQEYGVNCAIILENIYYWIRKNIANEKHYYGNHYWTYNSIKAFEELFPYLSRNQINTALQKLIDNGIIIEGNFNKSKFDKTKWYAITDFGFSVLEEYEFEQCKNSVEAQKSTDYPEIRNRIPENQKSNDEKSEIEYPKIRNRLPENQKPIPVINTSINALENSNNKQNTQASQKFSNADIENLFEEVWKIFPKKRGKGAISFSKKKALIETVGVEQLKRCVDRFINDMDGRDTQYIMYGSTFFNSGYSDYLDNNYTDSTDEEAEKPTVTVTRLNPDRPKRFDTAPDDTWKKLKPYVYEDGSFNWVDFDSSVLTETDNKWMRDNNM